MSTQNKTAIIHHAITNLIATLPEGFRVNKVEVESIGQSAIYAETDLVLSLSFLKKLEEPSPQ